MRLMIQKKIQIIMNSICYLLTWKPMLYKTTSAIRALSGNIIATGLNSNFKLSGNSCLSLCSFDSGFMVINLKDIEKNALISL